VEKDMSFKEELFTDLMELIERRISKHEAWLRNSDTEIIANQRVIVELQKLKVYVYTRVADYNKGLAKGVDVDKV
jgi:hypothetical protein